MIYPKYGLYEIFGAEKILAMYFVDGYNVDGNFVDRKNVEI